MALLKSIKNAVYMLKSVEILLSPPVSLCNVKVKQLKILMNLLLKINFLGYDTVYDNIATVNA